MAVVSISRSLMLATGCATLLSEAVDARVVHVPAICMRVTIPDGRRACLSLSRTWGYIHGVEFDIDADRNCAKDGAKDNPSMMGVWQDANTGEDTAGDYMRTECKGSKISWINSHGSRLAGMRSGFCVLPEDHQSVRVNMVGYAGIWEGKVSQPAIFYRIWMVTPRTRLRRDLPAFNAFVRSAKITDRRCLAALSG